MTGDDASATAPDRPLAGMPSATEAHSHDGTDGEAAALDARRRAVGALGDSLRELTSNAITTEVDLATLREVTHRVDELARMLGERRRELHHPPVVDDLQRGQRMYNPIVGAGNPVAPPVRIEYVDGAAVGTCTLDRRYEGPFTYAHGGVSAMLLDQVMGYAAAAAGHPSVTGRLEVRYRDAVPLGEPLLISAHLVDVLGVRAAIRGSIALADRPDEALVEAEGRFLALRADQADRLFGHVARGDTASDIDDAGPAGDEPISDAP